MLVSRYHRINHSVQPELPRLDSPRLSNERIHHSFRSHLIAFFTILLILPSFLSRLSGISNSHLLIFIAIQITPITLGAAAPIRSEVLAEVRVTFFGRDLLAANVAHGIAAVADEFVAARRFDEAEEAFWACSLDCCSS